MKKIISTIFILNLMLALAPNASAANSHAGMQARVQVNAVLKADLIAQTHSIEITAADIAKGYVDVEQATILDVYSNNRDGYFLSFEAEYHPFSEIWVMDNNRTTLLPNGSGYVHQSNSSNQETKRLSYRFILPQLLTPGSYDWPLLVSAVAN